MMPKKFLILFVLGISALTVSCGPTEEEVNATATQFAANIFATQTADAPTITPTPTVTPSPTLTPTITPTPTPDLNTLFAGLWHNLAYNSSTSMGSHQLIDCEEGEMWTCITSTRSEAELGFTAPGLFGVFEGEFIPDWNCPNWLPEAICRSAIVVIGGTTHFQSGGGEGPGLRRDIEYIVVEIGGSQFLYEHWVNLFACPWFRSFDEALAANPFPYDIPDCLQAP